ncbi:hypothetical protein ACLOJK_028897 [Asimina triloba]
MGERERTKIKEEKLGEVELGIAKSIEREELLRMSTQLQRSSISFRRQGSSGRIWENQVPSAPASGLTARRQMNDEYYSPRKMDDDDDDDVDAHPQAKSPHSHTSTPKFGSPRSHSHSQTSAPKCGFSSVFKRCLGSPPPQS